MSSDYQIDIDTQALDDAQLELETRLEEEEQQNILRQQQEEELQLQQEQVQAEVNDPRNKEGGGGFRGAAKEVQAALGGGIQDTASSLITLPERAIDMFSGEMVEEQQTDEGYNAEWDDWFVDEANPIETKTWWGGALRSLVHFGTMAAAIIPAAKAAGLTAATTALGSLGRGAVIGAASDLTSKYSQEDNGLAILRDRYNFIDTPISTQEYDHPAMKTLKNVVEGMGIGVVFDGLGMALGKGIKKIRKGKGGKEIIEDGTQDAVQRAIAREQNVEAQIGEKAVLQAQTMRGQYGAYKNKPISDPWQAAPNSTGKPADVFYQKQRIDFDYGSKHGSTDSPFTQRQIENMSESAEIAESEMENLLKPFMSDDRIKAEIAGLKSGETLSGKFYDSIRKAHEVLAGRERLEDINPDMFASFDARMDTIQGVKVWQTTDRLAADFVVGALVRRARDAGLAGRELFDIADLTDIDGPAKNLHDTLLAAVVQSKRSSYMAGLNLKNLDVRNPISKRNVREAVQQELDNTRAAYEIAFKYAGENPDDSLFRAYYEAVSMSDEIHNFTDFDNWIKKTLKGGYFNGQKKAGVLTKELQGVMINSVLSGPKTPARAIMGTGTATFLRPFSQVLGATLSGDKATQRASLASMNSMIQMIPEAWTLFKTKLNSYWSGDVSSIKTRYSDYSKQQETWEVLGDWIENSGEASLGDKGAYYTANMARWMNNNSFFTYSTKIMQATDETFAYILGRSRAREKAMRLAMDQLNQGNITEITPDLLKNAEDRFYSTIVDADGNITDKATLFARGEVTLTTELEGFSKNLQNTFEKAPWAKPFFLFARTGINGLTLTAKHTPIVNLAVKEFNDIRFATPDNLGAVSKYGIETAEDLANAKALQLGRLAIGGSLISMAGIHFMNGGLTGNGPTDRKKRQTWIDAGYKPRTISVGGVQVSYDSFEPFNLILSTVADIGDHSQLMGEEWTEDNFQKMAVVLMQAVSGKSYLAGMQQFVDLFAGKPGSWESIIGNLANNTMPMSSLRNELGKLINPGMKELNSGILQSIRNRNQWAEGADPEGGLPTKYDMLNGKPIKDWDFPTRMFNMFSPFSINLDQSDGRKLLFESGYDMRMSTYSSPDGIDLSKSPRLRSMYQKAIGVQNLEAQLEKLSRDPKILSSIQQMNIDRNSGKREMDPMTAYVHNKVIARLFNNARAKAWAQIKNDPEAQLLYAEDKRLNVQNIKSYNRTSNYMNPRVETNPSDLLLPYR